MVHKSNNYFNVLAFLGTEASLMYTAIVGLVCVSLCGADFCGNTIFW